MTLICRVVLFLVRSFNEHRILPPQKFKQIKNRRDRSGHAGFLSF